MGSVRGGDNEFTQFEARLKADERAKELKDKYKDDAEKQMKSKKTQGSQQAKFTEKIGNKKEAEKKKEPYAEAYGKH